MLSFNFSSTLLPDLTIQLMHSQNNKIGKSLWTMNSIDFYDLKSNQTSSFPSFQQIRFHDQTQALIESLDNHKFDH
jgi:hypothetical protein